MGWLAKQRGKPILLVVAGVSAVGFFWIGYKQFFSPWRTRRRLQENEEYANILIQSQDNN